MANEQDKNPTGQDADISKSQASQQTTGQDRQPEMDQDKSSGQPDDGQQGETATQQRSDLEGISGQPEHGEAESGFVGSKGQQDSSGELVSDDDADEDFAKDGQGAPEGK